MGLINTIKGWWNNLFKKKAQEEFNIQVRLSQAMEAAITEWDMIVSGHPPWENAKNYIESLNFAKTICQERARLTCLGIKVNVDGRSERAKFLQNIFDDVVTKLRMDLAERACAGAGIILKPNGAGGIDYVGAKNFLVTKADSNGRIRGVIFFDFLEKGNDYFTRLEYHRFETRTEAEKVYRISNKVYKSHSEGDLGRPIKRLSELPEEWKDITFEVEAIGLDKPLFAYYRTSGSNMIDPASPLCNAVFVNAVNELKALDISWSRKATEIEDSQHITFVGQSMINYAETNNKTLPRMVQGLFTQSGQGDNKDIHEHTPTLLTEQRIKDINNDLSFIGYKCGFDNGHFVFDEKTGFVTATQIESDKERTINTIKDDRDMLQQALIDLAYAVDMLTPAEVVPIGPYTLNFDFRDITYNFEEDRQRHYNMAMAGKYPWKRYFIDFEGYSEEDAAALIEEIREENETSDRLFDEE